MTTTHNTLAPDNDLLRTFYLEDVDPVTFATTPVTTGTVTFFLSQTKDGSAAATALSASAIHVGVTVAATGQYVLGTWGLELDATILTSAVLEPLFGATNGNKAYLIVTKAGAVRRYEQLTYATAIAATLG
jgi:hypothetical protein